MWGDYRGGRPAEQMGPPAPLPSATIRPTRRPQRPEKVEDTLADALVLAWHDVTCPEGEDCRDRSLHSLSGAMPVLVGRLVEHPEIQRAISPLK